MKFIKLSLLSLIFLYQFNWALQQSNGFLQSKESDSLSTASDTQQTTFERVVNFEKFTMELTSKNKTFIQKIQLIPMESNNTGSVFFSLKNNSGNGRGWKISLNKGQGYDTQNINPTQLRLLKKIFNKKLGKLFFKATKISKIQLFQPEENQYCGFEVSQLKNECWRIDVYPRKFKRDKYKYVAHLKMCAGSEEDQKKFRRFTYLLNNKSLGKISKE